MFQKANINNFALNQKLKSFNKGVMEVIYHADYYDGKNNWSDNDEIYGLHILKNKTDEYNRATIDNYEKQQEFYEKILSQLHKCKNSKK